jgi:hypothetical protein
VLPLSPSKYLVSSNARAREIETNQPTQLLGFGYAYLSSRQDYEQRSVGAYSPFGCNKNISQIASVAATYPARLLGVVTSMLGRLQSA